MFNMDKILRCAQDDDVAERQQSPCHPELPEAGHLYRHSEDVCPKNLVHDYLQDPSLRSGWRNNGSGWQTICHSDTIRVDEERVYTRMYSRTKSEESCSWLFFQLTTHLITDAKRNDVAAVAVVLEPRTVDRVEVANERRTLRRLRTRPKVAAERRNAWVCAVWYAAWSTDYLVCSLDSA